MILSLHKGFHPMVVKCIHIMIFQFDFTVEVVVDLGLDLGGGITLIKIVAKLYSSLNYSNTFTIYNIMNYRFLTTEKNLKALYIFRCFFTTSSVKLFVVTVQIFVYNSAAIITRE